MSAEIYTINQAKGRKLIKEIVQLIQEASIKMPLYANDNKLPSTPVA